MPGQRESSLWKGIDNMIRMKILIFALCLSVVYCDKDSSTNPSADYDSYTPLHSGDVTQLISVRDSSTVLLEIGEQVKRSDGLTVFLQTLSVGNRSNDTSYVYTDGEFLIDTNLDTIIQDSVLKSVNPFWEQRLAKSFPHENDTWLHTIGATDSTYFIAHKVQTINTLWAVMDGFAFDLHDSTGGRMISIYYAERLGWIGTTSYTVDTVQYICSYKKIGSKECGGLLPAKSVDLWDLEKKRQNVNCELTGRMGNH